MADTPNNNSYDGYSVEELVQKVEEALLKYKKSFNRSLDSLTAVRESGVYNYHFKKFPKEDYTKRKFKDVE